MDSSLSYSSAWIGLVQNLCGAGIALFLGGLNVLFSGASLYFFAHRKTAGREIFMTAIAIMLFLSLSELVLQIALAATSAHRFYTLVLSENDASRDTAIYNVLSFASEVVLVANNAVADCLFAYRCYSIWGPGKYRSVVIFPLVFLVATTILGFFTSYRNDIADPGSHTMDTRLSFTLAFIANLSLTVLTAGRLWWARRDLMCIGEASLAQRCSTAISVFLESGALYCLSLFAIMIALSFGRTTATGPNAILASLSYGTAGQLVNILPTIFLVRVCLAASPELVKVNDKLIV